MLWLVWVLGDCCSCLRLCLCRLLMRMLCVLVIVVKVFILG